MDTHTPFHNWPRPSSPALAVDSLPPALLITHHFPSLHVIGQVVLLQSVGLKSMWGRIKVVTAYPADEALGLRTMKDVRVKVHMTSLVPHNPSESSLP